MGAIQGWIAAGQPFVLEVSIRPTSDQARHREAIELLRKHAGQISSQFPGWGMLPSHRPDRGVYQIHFIPPSQARVADSVTQWTASILSEAFRDVFSTKR